MYHTEGIDDCELLVRKSVVSRLELGPFGSKTTYCSARPMNHWKWVWGLGLWEDLTTNELSAIETKRTPLVLHKLLYLFELY